VLWGPGLNTRLFEEGRQGAAEAAEAWATAAGVGAVAQAPNQAPPSIGDLRCLKTARGVESMTLENHPNLAMTTAQPPPNREDIRYWSRPKGMEMTPVRPPPQPRSPAAAGPSLLQRVPQTSWWVKIWTNSPGRNRKPAIESRRRVGAPVCEGRVGFCFPTVFFSFSFEVKRGGRLGLAAGRHLANYDTWMG